MKRCTNHHIFCLAPAIWILTGLLGIVEPAMAEPVTISYHGIIDTVDDRGGALDGSVVVGGTFSGTYTFESSAPDVGGNPTFAQYLYDEEAPVGMTMTATVGNYTFETENLDPVDFTSGIYVQDNYNITPIDAYHVFTREIVQTGGPILEFDGRHSNMDFELITFDNLLTFTSLDLPLSMPDLANFESTNRFTLSLESEDDPFDTIMVRGHLISDCPGSCPGDLDGNDIIMISDLGRLISLLGQAGPPYRISEGDALWDDCADMDGNGVIMVSDLGQLISILGSAGPPYRAPCP